MDFESLRDVTLTLPGGGTARVTPLTGRDEDWLAEARHLPAAAKVSGLLTSCLASVDGQPVSIDAVRNLLVGDRDFLILQLRQMTLGDHVVATLHCPACSEKMDVQFRISETAITERPQSTAAYRVELNGRVVQFRLPRGGDQEKGDGTFLPTAVRALLDRCILDDGGQPLTGPERDAVIDHMERLAPQVDLEFELACPECAHEFIAPFETTPYFLDELSPPRGQILRELHTLAFYYHWSEKDILNLGRHRRRSYLELLSETLRQD